MSENKGPLRVLHVIPTLAKGGAERLCLDIMRQMSAHKDVEVRLVTFRSGNAYVEEYPEIRHEVLDVHVIPSITGKWDVKLEEWNRVLNDFRPHIIHSHLYEAEMVVHYTLRPNVRYVMHCHQCTPQLTRFRWTDLLSKQRVAELYERNFMVRRFVQANNTFLCISRDTLAYFQKNLPARLHGGIHLVPNTLDIKRFKSVKAITPDKSERWRLINIGRFDSNKRQVFLIDVLSELIHKGIDAELTLVGEGPELERVKARSNEAGLHGQVHFSGTVAHIERMLAANHLYVHSAANEAFGLVLIEAMACGLPVVTLDGGGNRDLIVEGVNGFMVNQTDPVTFAERIIEICSDEEKHRRMATSARDFARGFDIGPYCEKLLDIYRKA